MERCPIFQEDNISELIILEIKMLLKYLRSDVLVFFKKLYWQYWPTQVYLCELTFTEKADSEKLERSIHLMRAVENVIHD